MRIFGSVCEEGDYFKNLTFCSSIFINIFFVSMRIDIQKYQYVSIFIADIPITIWQPGYLLLVTVFITYRDLCPYLYYQLASGAEGTNLVHHWHPYHTRQCCHFSQVVARSSRIQNSLASKFSN